MGEKINDDHSNSGDEYIRSKTTVLVEEWILAPLTNLS